MIPEIVEGREFFSKLTMTPIISVPMLSPLMSNFSKFRVKLQVSKATEDGGCLLKSSLEKSTRKSTPPEFLIFLIKYF